MLKLFLPHDVASTICIKMFFLQKQKQLESGIHLQFNKFSHIIMNGYQVKSTNFLASSLMLLVILQSHYYSDTYLPNYYHDVDSKLLISDALDIYHHTDKLMTTMCQVKETL